LKMKLLKWKVERLRCERIEAFTINIQITQKLFIYKFWRSSKNLKMKLLEWKVECLWFERNQRYRHSKVDYL
jgi:hypothetical protein